MKPLIKIVFLLVSISFYAQSNSLLKKVEWANGNLDYINFHDNTLEYYIAGQKHTLYYDVSKRSFSIKEKYVMAGIPKEESLTFKIKFLNKNKLVIAPAIKKVDLDKKKYKKLNYQPFFTQKEFIFYNRQNFFKPVNYKKITFKGSTCFGTCPSFTVEVNRDGKVYYQGRIYTKDFTGDFEGQLPMKERVAFIKILNRSQLAKIDKRWTQNRHVTDQPRYNYIVELKNGKKIEINTNDQHPLLNKLSNYFLAMPEKLELKRSEQKHAYVKPSMKGYEIVYRDDDE